MVLEAKKESRWKNMKQHQPSKIFIILIGIVAIWNATNYNFWKKKTIVTQDVIQYYSYLPAAFIEYDLKLDFIDDPFYILEPNQYWHSTTEEGRRVFKYTCGEALLISPFFFVANTISYFSDDDATGFGEWYQLGIVIAAVFYLIVGLFFLRRVLLIYFNEKVTTVTLLLITLATNLYYYSTVESGMSHVYNFALVSAFFYYTIRFHEKYEWRYAILCGLSFGMVVLLRPSNALFVILFMAFGVSTWTNLVRKLELFKAQFPKLLSIALLSFAVFFIQMLYWKESTGHWLYYSYMKEKFYFKNPHIIETLVGFRKGLLVYCPVLLFAFTGLFMSIKKHAELMISILLFILINIFVVSSWWCWWYGGSYGLRAYIDMYPLLAVCLAFFIQHVHKLSHRTQQLYKAIAVFLILLSFFQTYQYRKGILHYDGMTAKAYFNNFFAVKYPENYDQLIESPDYEKAVKNEE
jgi:hypothetical protein